MYGACLKHSCQVQEALNSIEKGQEYDRTSDNFAHDTLHYELGSLRHTCRPAAKEL